MKNNLRISNRSKALRNVLTTMALTFVTLLASTTNADANDKIKSLPVEIKYLGNTNQRPVFQIDFDNQEEGDVYLYIKDSYGSTVYTEVIKIKKYSKKFEFENMEINNVEVHLVFGPKGNRTEQVFQLNKNIREVQDIVIAKIR